MLKSWADQTVSQKSGWSYRLRYVDDLKGSLPLDLPSLNAALGDIEQAYKHDQTTTVSRLELPELSLVLKRYNPRTTYHKFTRALRRSRASRCWNMSYAFNQAGLNVAAPLLMYERRRGPIRMDAYFANAWLDGVLLIDALPQMTDSQQKQVRNAMQEAYRKMEAARISHGDLKASNLIWKNDQLYFIDLDAAQVHRNSVTWQSSHNRDKKRFLKNWRDHPELEAVFADI